MGEQKYLKYCSECAKTDDISGAKYHVRGYKSFYDSDDYENCLECGNKLVRLTMTCEDYRVLTHISTDPSFIRSMETLKQSDPIEFQLKMSQFKANLGQQESNKAQTDNKVHCKYCNSTNVKKISGLSKAGSVALWGIFSKKVHNEFHCNNCGADF